MRRWFPFVFSGFKLVHIALLISLIGSAMSITSAGNYTITLFRQLPIIAGNWDGVP